MQVSWLSSHSTDRLLPRQITSRSHGSAYLLGSDQVVLKAERPHTHTRTGLVRWEQMSRTVGGNMFVHILVFLYHQKPELRGVSPKMGRPDSVHQLGVTGTAGSCASAHLTHEIECSSVKPNGLFCRAPGTAWSQSQSTASVMRRQTNVWQRLQLNINQDSSHIASLFL